MSKLLVALDPETNGVLLVTLDGSVLPLTISDAYDLSNMLSTMCYHLNGDCQDV